jgi:uncharacterized protein with beta-barrel porin domain
VACPGFTGGGGGGGGADGFVGATLNGVVGPISGGNGGNGGNAPFTGSADGGSGGGGGAGAVITGGGSTNTSANVRGGAGGNGGTPAGNGGAAGFGGGGGSGVVDNGVSLTNSFNITGGNGGNGGAGAQAGGGRSGGTGGAGVKGSSFTLTNSGTIQGGNGGTTGANAPGPAAGAIAAGGAGIIGSDLTIINSGSIVGGMNGNGTVQANAITFTGGTNSLKLQAGYIISGNVVGLAGSSNTLILGGSTNASFDVSHIAPAGSTTEQYQGFTALQKTGTSSWDLTGAQTAMTPWTVNQGALFVDGSIASSSLTTVNSGGALHGGGTVGNTVIKAGGSLVPGPVGTPGSMSVAGNLAFQSGAFYVVQLTPLTASTTNVSGTASLAGTVVADFLPGSYVNHSYTILTAAGGVSGTFNALATPGLPVNFAGSLHYAGNNALLNIMAELVPEPNVPPPPPGPLPEIPGGPTLPPQPPTPFFTVNQLNVGHAIDSFFNNGGTLPPEFVSLFNLTGTNLTGALTQLSGENATGAERGAFQLMNGFLNLMLDPHVPVSCDPRDVDDPLCRQLRAIGFAPESQASLPPDVALAYNSVFKAPPKPAPIFEQRWTAWGAAFGGGATAKGDPIIGSNDVRTSTFGYVAGVDYHVSPGTVVGFALAGGGTSWNLVQGLGAGRSDALLAGIYGVTHQGPVYVAGTLAFANNWFTTDRTALGDQLTARFEGQSYAARLEGGYRFVVPATYNAIGITPYAAIQAQNFRTPTYSETDLSGGGFGLSYAAMNGTDTRSELGARFDDLTAFNAMPLILRGRVAWAHDWAGNPALNASFQSLPGTSFTVFGAPIPQDSALTTASAQLFFTPNWSVLVKFDGEFASSSQVYAGTGTLRYTW